MARYRVLPGKQGYVLDRMYREGEEFESPPLEKVTTIERRTEKIVDGETYYKIDTEEVVSPPSWCLRLDDPELGEAEAKAEQKTEPEPTVEKDAEIREKAAREAVETL